ncbi:unnamed protein product [Bemisia tabaci]|uniref:Fukutin n=1 Tax=Bemisia tabaci TaxID=7038 RepID=A0A9P0F517_BEMTA|nr:unnamed protein product [Bemisia tabaci]
MNKLYVLKTYFYCLICLVFCVQIVFLLFLIVEYKHGFTFRVPSTVFQPSIQDSNQDTTSSNWVDDFRIIGHVMAENHLSIYIIDKCMLAGVQDKTNASNCLKTYSPILLAAHYHEIKHYLSKVIQELQKEDFEVVAFFNGNPEQLIPELISVPVALFVKRKFVFKILFLHGRVDNFWWFGNIQSDSEWERKLSDLNVSPISSELMLHEGALEKFEAVKYNFGKVDGLIPRNVTIFLSELDSCKFIECNHKRAQSFLKKHGITQDGKTQRFQHKIYKILSLTSMIAKQLSTPFWLSSGTCLGYFRQCGIIPYTTDIDIGMFIESYNPKFEDVMIKHGFRLKHKFGLPNDSFELSFNMASDSSLKLDVFFFYKEGQYYWNGGTQVRTAKKFKYIFPKFHLCWTIFLNLKVRVPCETESYILANYGPNWMEPIKQWDWKSSPFNVQGAGVWAESLRKQAIQVF